MTREETKKIVMIIKYSYPNWKSDDFSKVIDVWSIIFEEDNYNLIEAGLKEYIRRDTSGFAPSPGQIREKQERFNLLLWGYEYNMEELYEAQRSAKLDESDQKLLSIFQNGDGNHTRLGIETNSKGL